MKYLKRKQKGQGIVEYALLLAFIVGIAMMLNGSNLGGAVKGVFDDVAMVLAFRKLVKEGLLEEIPVTNYISAISVGIIDGEIRLDLPYEEDSRAGVDMNIVMNDAGEYVEIQGTAEDGAFTPEELQQMLSYAKKGCEELMKIQKEVLEG